MEYNDYIDSTARHIREEIEVRLKQIKNQEIFDNEQRNILNAYNYLDNRLIYSLCEAKCENERYKDNLCVINQYKEKLNRCSINFLLNELHEEVNYLYFRKDIDIEGIEDESEEDEFNLDNYKVYLEEIIEELENLKLEKKE